MDTSTSPPAPSGAGGFLSKHPRLKALAIAVAAAALAHVLTKIGLDPKTAETTAGGIVPAVVPIKADEWAQPVNYEGASYHGGEGEQHVEANGRPFPGRDARYWVDYQSAQQIRPAASPEMVAAALRTGWAQWSDAIEINPQETTDRASAHLVISWSRQVFTTNDGPLGVLAACELGDGTKRQKKMVFDSAERWTMGPPADGSISVPTVFAHELGHWLALGHDDPNAPAIMRPSYTKAIPRVQSRDIDRAVQLGYERRARAPAGPTDLLSFPVQARTSDVIDALKKAGQWPGDK